jgi:2-C-methyl-D-erythritol 2,4-cyclodiphosphate synthase
MKHTADTLRIGHGYDLHRLEPRPPAGQGRDLVVGGVRLEHDRGPVAHSDGDVLLHALVDALMGENLGRNSAEFVKEAVLQVRRQGYVIGNVDATVILERPRIGPHKETIRGVMAGLLGIPPSRVNVKGKSHERVDAIGEGRAIEAHVVVLLGRPKEAD